MCSSIGERIMKSLKFVNRLWPLCPPKHLPLPWLCNGCLLHLGKEMMLMMKFTGADLLHHFILTEEDWSLNDHQDHKYIHWFSLYNYDWKLFCPVATKPSWLAVLLIKAELTMEILNKWDWDFETFHVRTGTGEEACIFQNGYGPGDKSQSMQWIWRRGSGAVTIEVSRPRVWVMQELSEIL